MKARKAKVISAPAPPVVSKTLPWLICLALGTFTLLVYFRTFAYGFVSLDDDGYVYENPMIKAGLSAKGLYWALTTFHFSLWHPVTWLSYLLDYQLFGLNAGPEHAVNAVIHVGAMVLLFFALLEMTQQPWRCAMVAGIFALHPVHVESVAWIAERKDVLSTFFGMLTLWFYARYAQKPTVKRYSLVALAFLLSLLAKPMAVTLPFVLLLLDVWPLRRTEYKRMIWEKVPLLAMSAGASVLTFLAQRSNGAVESLVALPITQRLANAAVAYVAYLGKAFWPVDLAVIYPLKKPSAEAVLFAVAALAAITAVAFIAYRRRPYLLMGWFWYLGMLVPVIGLVQVGTQSMADRFIYMPLVGFSIAVVWLVAEVIGDSPVLARTGAGLGGVALVAMAVVAYGQVEYWKDSETLFRHTLAVTEGSPLIENNLGVTLAVQGKHDEAAALYLRAIASDPDYAAAHANLGRERLRSGRMPEAQTELSEALRLKPDFPQAHEDLGLLLAASGRFAESSQHLHESLRLKADNPEAQSNLCFVLQHLGQLDEAIRACEMSLQLKPGAADARFNLGNALAAQGKPEAAAAEFSRALEMDPNYAPARAALDQLRTRSRP